MLATRKREEGIRHIWLLPGDREEASRVKRENWPGWTGGSIRHHGPSSP